MCLWYLVCYNCLEFDHVLGQMASYGVWKRVIMETWLEYVCGGWAVGEAWLLVFSATILQWCVLWNLYIIGC